MNFIAVGAFTNPCLFGHNKRLAQQTPSCAVWFTTRIRQSGRSTEVAVQTLHRQNFWPSKRLYRLGFVLTLKLLRFGDLSIDGLTTYPREDNYTSAKEKVASSSRVAWWASLAYNDAELRAITLNRTHRVADGTRSPNRIWRPKQLMVNSSRL